ncbi:hypothetical protein [Kamptonema formosum]|uniref:hypothetical protein n=1 Tax=Kamptonema formosum TaxID=331992 RepID=UPI00036086F3|nr:hypothetical protein [Oscillatoria sp. PCC 10802]
MPVSSHLNRWAAGVAAWALAVGCGFYASRASAATPASGPAVAASVTVAQQTDPFSEGMSRAARAANLARSAKTPLEWNQVAVAWLEAVAWMQTVPPGSPKRAIAQKKVAEYLRNFSAAQKKAAVLDSRLPFATFGSDLLDQQLLLYLSYLEAFGPPDILIVGSSRALQGVDPQALKQALAARGYRGLEIFNFSVNGATARVVDFKLRELLSEDQLPRLILWADGVRAFNNGRADRTYNGIVSSPGYQQLQAGIRPSLTELPEATAASPWKQAGPGNASRQVGQGPVTLAKYSKAASVSPGFLGPESLPSQPETGNESDHGQPEFTVAQATSRERALFNAIDANGFLPVSARFSPGTYYRQNPRVAGPFDGDYASFKLGGQQAAALNKAVTFTKSLNIPLVFVNLPLTPDYLDAKRRSAEQQFVRDMQRRAQQTGFLFRNLSQPALARNDYFADPSHINRYGAAAVSRQLAQDRTIPWPKAQS